MTTRALPWTPPPAVDVEPLRVGRWWDAVRAAPSVGEHALRLLGDNTGAVIQDTYGTLYWLIQVGSAKSWHLRQVRVLTELADEVTYLGVPPVHWDEGTRPHWRVPLAPDRYLTNAERLREALATADRAELGPLVEGRRLCYRCQLPTNEPVIVAEEHGGSLGGGTIYACPRHARSYRVMAAERLVTALRRDHEGAGT